MVFITAKIKKKYIKVGKLVYFSFMLIKQKIYTQMDYIYIFNWSNRFWCSYIFMSIYYR